MSAAAKTTVSTSGNTTTIVFPPVPGFFRHFTLSSHTTKNQQIVSVKFDNQSEQEYRLTGGADQSQTVPIPPMVQKVVFAFSYEANGESKTSRVRSGGPFALGVLQSIILAVENGDDVDYNDVLVQLLFK